MAKLLLLCCCFFYLALGDVLPLELPIREKNQDSIRELVDALKSANLPVRSQRVVLKQMGQALAELPEFKCNLFNMCFADPHCVYTPQWAAPVIEGCPQCEKTMSAFLESLLSTECATNEALIDEILPMVRDVAAKKLSTVRALKEYVPRIFRAASLTFPGKKLCVHITRCACGHEHSFGEIMTTIQKSHTYDLNITAEAAKDIFAGIWHSQICDLFADEDTPGYTGHFNHLDIETNSECEWCGRKSIIRKTIFHELVVVQLTKVLYGVMEGGLGNVMEASGGGNWRGVVNEVKQTSHTGVVVVLIFLLALAVAAFVSAVRLHRHRELPSQYIDLHSMGYTPPIL